MGRSKEFAETIADFRARRVGTHELAEPVVDLVEAYCEHGRPEDLAKLDALLKQNRDRADSDDPAGRMSTYWLRHLKDCIPYTASTWDESTFRLLDICRGPLDVMDIGDVVAQGTVKPDERGWGGDSVDDVPAEMERVAAYFAGRGVDRMRFDRMLLEEMRPMTTWDGEPTGLSKAGDYLLAIDAKRFVKTVNSGEAMLQGEFVLFMHEYRPELIDDVQRHWLRATLQRYYNHYELAFARGPSLHEPIFEMLMSDEASALPSRCLQLAKLLEAADGAYRDRLLPAVNRWLGVPTYRQAEHAAWAVKTYGADVLPGLKQLFTHGADNEVDQRGFEDSTELVGTLNSLGKAGMPALVEAMKSARTSAIRTRLYVLCMKYGGPLSEAEIVADVRQRAGLDGDALAVRAMSWLRGLEAVTPAARVETLFEALAGPDEEVRHGTAAMLAKINDAGFVERAGKMLADKKADARAGGVTLLAMLGTPRATELLEAHVAKEKKDDIRDPALAGMLAGWKRAGRTLTMKELAAWVERGTATKKPKKTPADWLDRDALPDLKWKKGKALTAEERDHLLFRQSRIKTMRPDSEVELMVPLLDEASGVVFGNAVLEAFFASKMAAPDRWLLVVAGMLADDAKARELTKTVREMVENKRGKMAEWVVEALALIGTDGAMLGVDETARRFATKYKNVGAAAAQAFTQAAADRGITPDELGDRVVPTLGFTYGQARVIDCGGTDYAVEIAPNLKFAYRNLKTDKAVKSLPGSCPAELKAEFKDAAKVLREVMKAQTGRLENLMVRQRRWPAADWAELFMQHPILAPIANQLLWGHYDKGKLVNVLRPLGDGTLTDADDEEVAVPTQGELGMIHPLELADDKAATKAWTKHVKDYKLKPPFAQMKRPVRRATAAQKKLDELNDFAGRSAGAMGFRSRSERRSWVKASAEDAGAIHFVSKSFPTAGYDAILWVVGYYASIDSSEDVTAEKLVFTKHAADGNQWGSEPVKVAEVPDLVFSEVMADLDLVLPPKADDEADDAE